MLADVPIHRRYSDETARRNPEQLYQRAPTRLASVIHDRRNRLTKVALTSSATKIVANPRMKQRLSTVRSRTGHYSARRRITGNERDVAWHRRQDTGRKKGDGPGCYRGRDRNVRDGEVYAGRRSLLTTPWSYRSRRQLRRRAVWDRTGSAPCRSKRRSASSQRRRPLDPQCPAGARLQPPAAWHLP